jgi:uncharacterized protein Yka (UPF0111/DUF47 family)
MMIFKFLPKEFNFFQLFDKQVDHAIDAAKFFKELVLKGVVDDIALKKMEEIEHQGDDAAHIIIDQLNKSFITPFDREDIFLLVKELDDITDMIDTIINRLFVYKLIGVNKRLVEFSYVIEESVRAVANAVKGLRNMKNVKSIKESCVEVNRLENVGDTMRDEALADLFETEKNPIAVIKWKEIYTDAETVLDVCEDVAHVIESIIVKQA